MGELTFFLPLLIILGAFMFFASRRQRKAMQATINLHDSLVVGDRVHTTSGMEATVAGVSNDTVDLEIAPGVVTTWMKLAIRDKIEESDSYDEDDSEEYEYEDDDVTASDVTDSSIEAPGTQSNTSQSNTAQPNTTSTSEPRLTKD
jgi:preprotein translocase subunit YajC